MDALPFLPFFDFPVKLPAGDFTANIVAELRLSIARNGRNPDQYLEQLDHFERLRHSMLQILSQAPDADTVDLLTSYTAQMFSVRVVKLRIRAYPSCKFTKLKKNHKIENKNRNLDQFLKISKFFVANLKKLDKIFKIAKLKKNTILLIS